LIKTSLQKCKQCNEPLRFDEKSIRYENDWFHIGCFIIKTKKSQEKSPQKHPLLNIKIIYELDTSQDKTSKTVPQHIEPACPYCKKPMKFEEKTQRYKNIWFQELITELWKIITSVMTVMKDFPSCLLSFSVSNAIINSNWKKQVGRLVLATNPKPNLF